LLAVGTEAPDFAARLDDGGEFRLSLLRGEKNVVLYFYPRDNSKGCTAQACSFRDNYGAITAFDAVIIGLSGDSEESHREFREHYSLGFPLVSDRDGRLRELYDVKTRITYGIDKQGMIQGAFRHDVAIGRQRSDTLAALQTLNAREAAAG
jgi:peroxiredoxin Q/BCP